MEIKVVFGSVFSSVFGLNLAFGHGQSCKTKI